MRARRNRKPPNRPDAVHRCSGTSSRTSGRRRISRDTSRPQGRVFSPCSTASCYPPSVRNRLTASPRRRSGTGSTGSAGPPPGNANKALDLLRQIVAIAIACDHLQTNPTREVRKNPGRVLTRFLSREEVARLHRVPDRQIREQQAGTGGHHPAALAGSRWRQAGPRRWQDRAQGRSFEYAGTAHSRTPPGRRKSVRLSVPERSLPVPQRTSPVLVPRPARGMYRRYSPSRPAPHPYQLRSDDRGAGAGGLSAARSFRRSTTLWYAHLRDREIEAAAERTGQAIAALLLS